MPKGGFILQARSIEDSEVAHFPPHVREVWSYFLRKANFKDHKVAGKVIKRGELLTSYQEIIENLHWKVGFRKERYSKWQIETAMKLLMKITMVTTTRTTRGMIVTVCNYDKYQDPETYENHNGNHMKTTMKPHDKEIQVRKKEQRINKEEYNTLLSELESSDGEYENLAFSFWKLFMENMDRLEISNTTIKNAKAGPAVKTIRLMMEKDGRTIEEMREVWQFLRDERPNNNGFSWGANIRSVPKLREKFEDILIRSRQKARTGIRGNAAVMEELIREVQAGTFQPQ